MKHKFLTSLIVAMGITGAVTTFTNVSQPQIVKASKSGEISWQGYEVHHPRKYFRNWRSVVLTDKVFFELMQNDNNETSDLPYILKTKSLDEGEIIQLKSSNGTWYVRGKQLPKQDGYTWVMPKYTDSGKLNDRVLYEDGSGVADYNFATTTSYSGVSTIFRTPRKVIVTRNVRANKLRMVIPLYKIHSVGHKTIKKGTILKVGAPTNHWNHEIWGKGVNPTHKYVWVVDRLTGWYKLID